MLVRWFGVVSLIYEPKFSECLQFRCGVCIRTADHQDFNALRIQYPNLLSCVHTIDNLGLEAESIKLIRKPNPHSGSQFSHLRHC